MRLAGEVALVTGSTAGIGRAVAERFAREGAAVVVTGRDGQRGEEVVEAIRAAGGSAVFIAADLTDAEQRNALVTGAAQRFGPVTVLVNNAVVSTAGRDGPVTEVTPEAWADILAGDLIAPADLCRLVIPQMRDAGHGSIVNVSSRAAARSTPGHAAYAAAKGGLEALTRAISIDHARDAIRCNVVRPAYVLNDRRDADLDDARLEQLQAMHLTRLPRADDVAAAVTFLASNEAATITGTVLDVDGGSVTARAKVIG